LNFISKGLGIKNLLQVLLGTTTELSEIEKRNLDSNTELWKAESKYIKLEPCSTIYINNPVGSAVNKISMIKSVLPFSVTFRIYYY
jgi:hypothetical protein